MSALAARPSIAEVRRSVAVGWGGTELGLDTVPGVVVADVEFASPLTKAWMPVGHVVVAVWGGDGPKVWAAIQGSPFARGYVITLQVYPAGRWARARAWWRWTLHRLERMGGER